MVIVNNCVILSPNPRRQYMHLMLDIETGGIRPGCAIFAIGAAVFNPYKIEAPIAEFYEEISHQSNIELGLQFERETMHWWNREAPNGNMHIRDACEQLIHWLYSLPSTFNEHIITHWANSPSFDYTILKHVLNFYNLIWPFPYWQERDVRTLKFIAFPNGDYSLNNTHNALADCKNQILLVQHAYQTLGLSHENRSNPPNHQKPRL